MNIENSTKTQIIIELKHSGKPFKDLEINDQTDNFLLKYQKDFAINYYKQNASFQIFKGIAIISIVLTAMAAILVLFSPTTLNLNHGALFIFLTLTNAITLYLRSQKLAKMKLQLSLLNIYFEINK
jgi:hypothetical protein